MSKRAQQRQKEKKKQKAAYDARRAANPEKYAYDPNKRQMGRGASKRRQEAAKSEATKRNRSKSKTT